MIDAPKTLTYKLSIGTVDTNLIQLLDEIEKIKNELLNLKPKAEIIKSVDGFLKLTEAAYQRASVEEDVVAVLPSVDGFIEITLLISGSKEINFSLEGSNIKGVYDKTIKPGMIYEYIFTHTEEKEWLVGNLSF